MEDDEDIQRKMADIRREIDKGFAECQGLAKDWLEVMTRNALSDIESQQSMEVIDPSASKKHRLTIEQRTKMEGKVSEMEELQRQVQQLLEPLRQFLQKKQLGSKDRSSEGRQAGEDAISLEETEKQDKALEQVLEKAAVEKMKKEYKDLDNNLKMCLLCFSIFPVDKMIEKKVLIYWWIGEGFATATESKSAEKVAEDHFDKLKHQGFILPVYNRRRDNVLRCRLHPWIRWFIIKMSREESFFDLDEKGMPSLHTSKLQRVCFITENKDGLLENPYCPESKEPTPRTVFNVNVKCLKLKLDALPKFKSLVVLQLGRWVGSHNDHKDVRVEDPKKNDNRRQHIEIDEPESLDKLDGLLNLRYLGLRGLSRIMRLPKWIGACRRLEILDLRGCQNLDALTEDIKSLEKLTHLDVSECYMLEYMPKALTHLSELEVLKGFVVGGSTSTRHACKIADLTNLKKLRKFSIRVSNLVGKSKDLNDLKKIESLETLAITWSGKLLEDIAWPANLVKLDLRCFPGEKLSEWLQPKNLQKLQKLYIRGGMLRSLHLEEYGYIKMLRLKYLQSLELKENDINELRRTLDYMEIYECPKIELSYPFDLDGVWVNDDPHPEGAPAALSTPSTDDPHPEGAPAALSTPSTDDPHPEGAPAALSTPSTDDPHPEGAPAALSTPSTAPASGPVSATATSESVHASAPASAVPAAASSPPADASSSPVPGSTTDSTSVKDASVTPGATPVLASTAATSSDPSRADHESTQPPSTVATPAPAAAPSPASASVVAPSSTSGSVPTTPTAMTETPGASSIPPPPAINPSQ